MARNVSEELLQKGYLTSKGRIKGDRIGPYEGFNLGATTFDQLRRHKIIPDRSYGKWHNKKPDGIVVDRRGASPIVKFVAEFKDAGGLQSERKTRDYSDKVAEEYCRPLGCEFGGISDHVRNSWLLVTASEWHIIRREDAYPLDYPIDLADDAGRSLLGRTLLRLETVLSKPTASLVALQAVDPTRLAEQTWQDIWLACGEQPEACLATFIELLIFKFLSDLGVLRSNPNGVPVDFETVIQKDASVSLKYYFETVRPEIRRQFPAGSDGTSVINGIALNPNAQEQGRLFHQILQRFKDFGSLKKIDPEFKSRIFERFLRKSLSVKNWGQYFTPRNVVKAMVEMSGIERLAPGATVADPACGVGGFLLEPLMNKRPHDFRSSESHNLKYVGWDRDDKTIILAKANMLVHLSEALEQDPAGAVARLAPILNGTFHSLSNSLTGSLSRAPVDQFDLVMTNPPYVTRGTGKQREFLRDQAGYYSVSGSGVENLFTQLIINGLKPGCRGLVIVPDGLLLRHAENALREHILKTCDIEAIVSLPVNTFYSTPKKTYILALRKKQRAGDIQTSPVFTYLVGSIGETLDAKRFTIAENDLPTMAGAFQQFQGNPNEYTTKDPRCRIVPIDKFKPEENWLVNKWWPLEEREKLGDAEAECFVSPDELAAMLQQFGGLVGAQTKELRAIQRGVPISRTITLALDDSRFFRMSIGKRVLKKDLFHAERGEIPLYSANVEPGEEHGWVHKSNIDDFSRPSLLWSIDSDFNMTSRKPGERFASTDHCGRLEILDSSLLPEYCQAAIVYGYGRSFGFDRVTRPSLQRMAKVTFRVPVKEDGTFDVDAQRDMAKEFTAIQSAVREIGDGLDALSSLKPKADIPTTAEDLGMSPRPAKTSRKKFTVSPVASRTFRKLAEEWAASRPRGVDVADMVDHAAYKQIIEMGAEAVPLLLGELQNKPGHWFWALHAITGVNPVTAANEGKIGLMAKAWIEWGRKQGYIA